LIEDMRTEWQALDQRINALDEEFTARAREDADARRLTSIPGIGVLNATALTAAIGTGETFAPRVRAVAAWIGFVIPGALEDTHGSLRTEVQRRGGGPLVATRELIA
jgi:transposase